MIDSTQATGSAQAPEWRRWLSAFALAVLLPGLALAAFVVVMDPYGMRASARQSPRPLMDINQRYMYPQVVRTGRFDAALFGTSTVRLLDPATLSPAFGASFANLGMNAATPWEQVQLFALFRREVAQPKAIIWGIDTSWCEADATTEAKRLTPRPFPPWLYDSLEGLDWRHVMNFTTLEIAVRLASHRLGMAPERIRRDGYEIFTPSEASYNLAQAQSHLYRVFGGKAHELGPMAAPEAVTPEQRASWTFPAMRWLEQELSALPQGTQRMLLLTPVHAASLPREGSIGAAQTEACRSAIEALARRQDAALVDFRFRSEITVQDANYWDPLHFRLGIARRIETVLMAFARKQGAISDPAVRITPPR
ncbi:MAG: hypothetical protein ACRC56_10300 [Bosea sp. (in: a-proteobacteria)]